MFAICVTKTLEPVAIVAPFYRARELNAHPQQLLLSSSSSMSMVSLLVNPLATADQLAASPSQSDGVPADMEASLRWAASTLIQSAGILLRL